MAARKEKRWLKSVADPDLVGFFEDVQFEPAEYAKGFYEQREASHAAHRVEKLEGLKRQTEEALRAEVVRNYKAFMHATEEIRSMETGIQTLKDLLGATSTTLQTFRTVRLVEAKSTEKGLAGRSTARIAASGSAGATAGSGTAGANGAAEDDGIDADAVGPSRGLKLPEWLDQAPIELEELLLERKHQEAATLIRRVREFSGNVQNATNLGRGVERIFQRVEAMAAGMADRLLSEIAAANTLTVWGFREHKCNFALLIALGHGEKAAVSFVGERSAMIRRSLRLVEVTADPLSYVGILSETFFGQVSDAVMAFLKLFCGSAKIHQRRSNKSGKSIAYYQVYQGVKACGTAPFCRLVVWMNQQIDQYALLVGRQIRGVTMGPQRVTRSQSAAKKGGAGPGAGASATGSAATGSSQLISTGSWMATGEEAGFRLGPVASSLFSIVSLMLEEAFAAAATLNTAGFPVGVQLASRLVPDVTHFLSAYVDNVKENLVEAIRKDAFVGVDFKLMPPEALAVGAFEEEERKAQIARLTSSARIMVLEARDILDYALVLLEPPPPEEEAFALMGAGGVAGASSSSINSNDPAAATAADTECQVASYYTRDEFLELEPVIVTSLEQLLRIYLKETMACMRSRRDDLSTNQAAAASMNLKEIGGCYVPLLASWCAELLPEIADEEEVTNLRALEIEFQRSASNRLRPKESASSSSLRGSLSNAELRHSVSSTSSFRSTGTASTSARGAPSEAAETGAAALARVSLASTAVSRASVDSTGLPNRTSVDSSVNSRRESETGGGGTSGGSEKLPSLETRRGSSRHLVPGITQINMGGSSRVVAANAAAEAAVAAAAAANAAAAAAGSSSSSRNDSRPTTAIAPGSTAPVFAGPSARTGSLSTSTPIAARIDSAMSTYLDATSGGRRGSGSSAGGGSGSSSTEPINITNPHVRALSSSFNGTSTAGGGEAATGSGVGNAPLPAAMRRPALTLKAAQAAAKAKREAAEEAKAKAAASR